MKRGTLIVFEGIDGVGKATQVKMLARELRKRGTQVTTFSFPDYTDVVGNFIRESLQNKHGEYRKMDAYHTSLPFAVDRGLAGEKISNALRKGIVICDRYTTSNLAFGAANCEPAQRAAFRRFFEKLEYGKFKLPRPDIVLYLSLPVTLSQKRLRIESNKKLDANERDVRYQKEVTKEYAVLARRREWHTIRCESGEPPQTIHSRVWDAVRKA
ncbi:MAG: dTMP kinase [Candidatus Paceibacterota bacterium]